MQISSTKDKIYKFSPVCSVAGQALMESDKTKLNNSNKLSKTLNLTAKQIGADKCENEPCFFLDALASLDFTLVSKSVSESVVFSNLK